MVRHAPRTQPLRPLWILIMGVAIVASGCSSDPVPSASNGTTPGTVADTSAVVTPTVSYRVTTEPGSTIPPTPQAVGQGGESQKGADALNACVATKDCREIEAPLVVWPGADLSGFDFRFAVLSGADLRSVRAPLALFGGADLRGADLAGANLSGASLSGTDLSGANLSGADLSATDLRGAILVGAISDGADFDSAQYCNTQMPDGTLRDDHC